MKTKIKKNVSITQQYLAYYHKNQPNKFNEDLIYGLRERDQMIDYLEDTCKALEAIPYIKYKGYDILTDENKFKATNHINITDSRLDLISFKFTVSFKGETSKITMPIYIPKWINKYYFILNGNKYFPIYQHVETSTYNTKNGVTLKSLLMAIILQMSGHIAVDNEDNKYKGRIYSVNLFGHKSNMLHYYFANMGYDATIAFFGYNRCIFLTDKQPKHPEKVIMFPVTKSYNLIVPKVKFTKDSVFKNFVHCVLDMFNKRITIDKIKDKEYWKTKLGGIFTKNTNNQLDKAATFILSFKRILDNRTKKNLLIPDEDKKDIFHLIKYMVINFDLLMRKDNLSLLNKRLRLCEYIITPFVRKMSNNTYRILNSKTLNLNKLKGILKPSSMVIISDLQKSKLLRFNNATNDMDLFNCALKWSNRGPSALGEGSRKTVSIIYRGLHLSHLGRLSLNTVSSSDPGMSGCLSPFVETNGFYYSNDGTIVTIDDELNKEQEE